MTHCEHLNTLHPISYNRICCLWVMIVCIIRIFLHHSISRGGWPPAEFFKWNSPNFSAAYVAADTVSMSNYFRLLPKHTVHPRYCRAFGMRSLVDILAMDEGHIVVRQGSMCDCDFTVTYGDVPEIDYSEASKCPMYRIMCSKGNSCCTQATSWFPISPCQRRWRKPMTTQTTSWFFN